MGFCFGVTKKSIIFVPQNRVWVVERFGKYHDTKEAGLNFIVPFVDRIAADHQFKEVAVDAQSIGHYPRQYYLTVDGVLYFRVLDPLQGNLRCG